jgi:hypothetical protein
LIKNKIKLKHIFLNVIIPKKGKALSNDSRLKIFKNNFTIIILAKILNKNPQKKKLHKFNIGHGKLFTVVTGSYCAFCGHLIYTMPCSGYSLTTEYSLD